MWCHMHKRFKNRKRLVIYLDATEYETLKAEAGTASVSAHIRSRLSFSEVIEKTMHDLKPKISKAFTSEVIETVCRADACPHGTPSGKTCLQCLGMK